MSDELHEINRTLGVLVERSEQQLRASEAVRGEVSALRVSMEEKNSEQDERLDSLEKLGAKAMGVVTVISALVTGSITLISKFWDNISHTITKT